MHKKKKYPRLTRLQDETVQQDFFAHEYIKKIDVDKWVAERANRLAWEHGIDPNDAIHVASAVRASAEVLHHWDGDFSRVPSDIVPNEEPTSWEKQMSMMPED